MPLSKLEKWGAAGLALLLLAGGGAAGAALTHANLGKADLDLIRRANMISSKTGHQSTNWGRWFAVLTQALNLPAETAAAVCRWFGIESGGDPLTVSKIGERGLAQIGHAMAITDGALTPAEWAAMIDPKTSDEEHARIAWKVIEFCYRKATKYITRGPLPTDEVDQVFYAKLYHQRPVAVKDAHLTGEARADSSRLEMQWASDALNLHYLHSANVVAWDSINAPFPGLQPGGTV